MAEVLVEKHAVKTLLVIPARYGSSRFPGKALALLRNKPVIHWVVQRALEAQALNPSIHAVVVATDDERIAQAAVEAGAEVCLTSPNHPSGSDRVWEVASHYPNAEFILNIQGDEPDLPPSNILTLLQALQSKQADITTLCCPLQTVEDWQNPNIVKLVMRENGLVYLFSRSPIPYNRQSPNNLPQGLAWHHLGVYGYTRSALEQFVNAPPSGHEQTECLEQLRAMGLGLSILAIPVTMSSIGVDTPEDLQRLEELPAPSFT
jgi:3-deoxy-manno-octulosonate cytidylyltransferase (CMP-KDO synthetase)